jgi:general stress protein 26
MDLKEMFSKLDRLLGDSRTGILTTVDKRGYPRSRWMTPALVPGREGNIYGVTSPTFEKALEIIHHPEVSWLFQSKALDEILTASGKITLINNPALKSEVLEALGRNLAVFWRVNPNEKDLVVLETQVEEMTYFKPMKNVRFKVVV